LYVRSRAISSRTNDNHDTFEAPEIEQGYRTFLGKPAFVNHRNSNHRRARGVIVAVALHRDRNPDGSPDTWVEALHELDAVRFPKLAKAIIEGRVNRTSMGVDCEYSTCSACGNRATNPAEYCAHLPARKGLKIRQRNNETGKLEEKLIHEICAGLTFFENSFLVEDPADPTAHVLDKPDDRGMKINASRHVLPGAPHADAVDRGNGNAVPARYVSERERPGTPVHPVLARRDLRQQFTLDDPDILFGQPAVGMSRPASVPFFGHHVSDVVGPRAEEPVHRVHARRPVTAVEYPQARRDRAANQRPSVSRSQDTSAVRARQREPRVAGPEESSRPRIAESRSGREVDFRQEALDLGLSAREASVYQRSFHGRDSINNPRQARYLTMDEARAAGREAIRRQAEDPRFDGVGLKQDDDGWYVRTHRARSRSHPVPEAIPAKDIEFIRSTGSRRTARNEEGGEMPVVPSSRLPRVSLPESRSSYEQAGDFLDNLLGNVGNPDAAEWRPSYPTRGWDDERQPRLHEELRKSRERNLRRDIDDDSGEGLASKLDRPEQWEHQIEHGLPESLFGAGVHVTHDFRDDPEGFLRDRWNMRAFPYRDPGGTGPGGLKPSNKWVRKTWQRAVGPLACDHPGCPPWEHRGPRPQASLRTADRDDDYFYDEDDDQHPDELPSRRDWRREDDVTRSESYPYSPSPGSEGRDDLAGSRTRGRRAAESWDGFPDVRPAPPSGPRLSSRVAAAGDSWEPDQCPECGEGWTEGSSRFDDSDSQCLNCGTRYNAFSGAPLSDDEIAVNDAAMANEQQKREDTRSGQELWRKVHPGPGHEYSYNPAGDNAPLEMMNDLQDQENQDKSGPLRLNPRLPSYEKMMRRRRERAIQQWPSHQEVPVAPPGTERLSSRMAKGRHDYRMMHQAPDRHSGVPYHEASGADPDDLVTIYRGVPRNVKTIHRGDWVTTDPAYAHQHGRHNSDPSKDWPVLQADVPARHLYWDENDENEIGYQGPHLGQRDVSYHEEDPDDVPGAADPDAWRGHFASVRRRADISDDEIRRGLNLPGSREEEHQEDVRDKVNGLFGPLHEDYGGQENYNLARQNDTMTDLQRRFEGGRGRFAFDEEGDPYYEARHPSGWRARVYTDQSGEAQVHHDATGDEAHDVMDIGEWGPQGHRLSETYGPADLDRDLAAWHGDDGEEGYRAHLEQEDPRIRRRKRRHQGARRTAADQPPRMPPPVDTLRPDKCPVCGDSDVFKGQRCSVCGFVAPPDIFRDPDTQQAAQNHQMLEEGKVPLGMPEGPADEEQVGSGQDADDQLLHPDQIAPDGVPGVQPGSSQPENGPLGGGQDEGLVDPSRVSAQGDVPEEDEEQAAQQETDEGEQQAAEGQAEEEEGAARADEAQAAAAGEQEAEDADADASPRKDQDDDRPGGKRRMAKQQQRRQAPPRSRQEPRTAATAVLAAQQDTIRRQAAQIRSLAAQMSFLADLAGVRPQMEQIRRQADMMNPASPVPDPPERPPYETTEQALQPETMGDASRPGTEPGSTSHVPAAMTTTSVTPGVEIQTAPASYLDDVTAPVQGTNPSEDGGVPVEQRRIETDVRIDPDPLKAQGPGIGGLGSDGTAYPWVIAARGGMPRTASQAAASQEDEHGARTFASIRLARARVTAGLARGDELEGAALIEKDASLSLRDIEREIGTLEKVAAAAPPQRPRASQRTAARSAPSMSAPPQLARTASYSDPGDPMDASDVFLD
jgi:hypothetical protein